MDIDPTMTYGFTQASVGHGTGDNDDLTVVTFHTSQGDININAPRDQWQEVLELVVE